MTKFVRVPGKAVFTAGAETQILIPSTLLKGPTSSMIPSAVMLMIVGWIWEYLTSTVDLKHDRILEGLDILKTYLEKAPNFVKKEDINTEWDTEVHSRLRDAAVFSMDFYMHTMDLYYQSKGMREPNAPPITMYEDNTKPEEEKSKADPSDFKEDYNNEKKEYKTPLENQEKQDDITVMKEEIKAINKSLKKMNDFIDEQRKKEDEKTTDDLTLKDGEVQPASLSTEQTNIVVEEVRVGFENIMTAFASQTGVDPTAGEKRILTVSLTDENANNISTLIVEKLNEEGAIEPVEKTAEGVTNEDLGIEVRDSKRSLKGEISDLKSKLDFLIKLIGKKAITFEDIYQMLARRMARDHEMQTGRKINY